jgi:hypothetical protein
LGVAQTHRGSPITFATGVGPERQVHIGTQDPLALAVVEAIHTGDLPTLKGLLRENPALATARLGDDDPEGMSRTLLHVATDWPGHFPNGAATVAVPGLMDRLEDYFASGTPPSPEEINRAFWGACHGGQRVAAEYLLDRGGDLNWIPPWEKLTPLDAARRSDAGELVEWLLVHDAKSASEVG